MARKTRGGTAPVAKAPLDAYVGLLAISLLAQIAGAVFFFLDYNQYPTTKAPDLPKITSPASPPPAGGAAGGGGAGAGGGGAAGAGGAAGMGGGAAGMGGMAGMGGGMAGMGGGNK